MAVDAVPLLRLEHVRKYFSVSARPFALQASNKVIHAVDDVSFDVREHETMSLVGESGCGKTTTARMILRLDQPTAGTIAFRGLDVHRLNRRQRHEYAARVQAVFQDPWSSLNPRMRVREIIAEPLQINLKLAKREMADRVEELLRSVGLEPALAGNFPHEFSGGQRQRIAVARALALEPQLIVLDEPVSSLDVSIGAQVMNLLRDLQERLGTTYLLIAHNLGTVRYLSHRLAVMYLGQIVEDGPAEELFDHPRHPYTQALIDAALPTRPGDEETALLVGGELPSATDPPSGCRFRTRCPFAFDRCALEAPVLKEVSPSHRAACHLC